MAYTQCIGLPAYNCDPCESVEQGRVRAFALVNKSYIATILANPADSATWAAGVGSGQIFIVPESGGNVALPSAKTVTGFGDTPDFFINDEYTATLRVPNYKSNCTFWNLAKQTVGEWHLVTKTSSQIQVGDKPCVITGGAEIKDDLYSQVTWEIQFKWVSRNLPCPFNAPADIFVCPN